jgi:surfeit locus 1 family protein
VIPARQASPQHGPVPRPGQGTEGEESRARLTVPILFTLVSVATFIGLGTWQIDRKAWKEALIETLDQRLSADPTELPPLARWADMQRADDEFRRVKLRVEFPSGREALMYSGAPALRPDIKAPGYFVFALARTRDEAALVINRGYVPQPIGQAGSYAAPSGVVEVVGALRWPEAATPFVRPYDPAAGIWFVRDHVAMAAHNGWGAVAPFYLELESPQPAGGFPRAGALRPKLRNEHLQYAITWYGLALVVVVMFTIWLINRPVPRS